MFIISKDFPFSASHEMPHLPDGHKCRRLHGHNYIVRVELASNSLDENGFVIDYGDLAPLRDHIDSQFDHRHLNDVLGGPEKTTAEALAFYFFTWCRNVWPQTKKVSVSETPRTWASFQQAD